MNLQASRYMLVSRHHCTGVDVSCLSYSTFFVMKNERNEKDEIATYKLSSGLCDFSAEDSLYVAMKRMK